MGKEHNPDPRRTDADWSNPSGYQVGRGPDTKDGRGKPIVVKGAKEAHARDQAMNGNSGKGGSAAGIQNPEGSNPKPKGWFK